MVCRHNTQGLPCLRSSNLLIWKKSSAHVDYSYVKVPVKYCSVFSLPPNYKAQILYPECGQA